MDYLNHLDDELRRAAEMQPYVAFTDPLAARAAFARSVKISNFMRGISADKFGATAAGRWVEAAGGRRIAVRICTPLGADPPLPALLYLHGGAFVAGDLETEYDRCLRLARDVRCIVVGVDYRLAPEHPFPAGAEDCYAVLCWLAAGGAPGVDTERIAIGGSSAGGTLTATVTALARDRNGPRAVLQMLLYPALDDRMQTGSMRRFPATTAWTTEDSRHMWRHYLGAATGEVSPHAAPARMHDLRGLPPAYVLTAEVDALRDEGIDYAIRLTQAGVPTELHQLSGTFHGFDLAVPDAAVSLQASTAQSAALARAFRQAPRPQPPDGRDAGAGY